MKKIFKFIRNIIILCIVICIILCSAVVYKGYTMYKEAIAKISIEDRVNEIRSDENYVNIKDLPKDYVNAVISIEDHRFSEHFGVDIIALSRAIVTNIASKNLTYGGSTITQQLAKNMYFTQEKLFSRKIAEVFVALKLEEKYSKDDIFEMYVNISYFGDGYYGIKEATLGYINKEPKDMNLNECTLLAGIPNAPSVYALSNNSKFTFERQVQVIDAMVKYNKLDSKEAEKIKKEINK